MHNLNNLVKYKILLNNSMLVNYSLDSIESENASNSVTLVPRLDYSVNLLTGIIEILQEKRIELKNTFRKNINKITKNKDKKNKDKKILIKKKNNYKNYFRSKKLYYHKL